MSHKTWYDLAPAYLSDTIMYLALVQYRSPFCFLNVAVYQNLLFPSSSYGWVILMVQESTQMSVLHRGLPSPQA